MDRQRPRGREKNVTGAAKRVEKQGEGLGTGPVGVPRDAGGGSGGSGTRASGGRVVGGPKLIILLIALLLGGGGSGLMAILGGPAGGPSQPSGTGLNVSALMSSLGGGSVSSGWQGEANTGRLNASVDPAARDKRVKLLGNGRDTATIMVYMCGTDLESRAGMGTSDLQEMLAADLGKNINLLVYTGGCKGWKNNQVSSSVNQIWQIRDRGTVCLEKDLGAVPMTDPMVLAGFIQYCKEAFPASRYELILWDHGGGSISGYGYDEKFAQSGSMGLSGIDQALTRAGVTFDFIGFDACLMATAENALMLTKHADYLIASEETEPGVGWYYTNWLTSFGKNPSMPTIELGKKIADDFVDVCAQKCAGQLTTLSVIDLAELEETLPDNLNNFSKAASRMIVNKEYQAVSNARSNTREFAQSSKIDHVDLVHLAKNLGTKEAAGLSDALLSAVKYNRTSSNMTNAYGVSIYFPYRNNSSAVNNAVRSYQAVGMDSDYIRCIQAFSDMKTAGQQGSSGTGSPLGALTGMLGSGVDLGDISQLLSAAMGSGMFSDRSLDLEETAQYVSEHRFTWEENGVWSTEEDGVPIVRLSEEQWSLVQNLDLNVFYDDGAGYIDLGLDNVFEFNENGDLIGVWDGSWPAINGQPVAYYHTSTVDDGDHYAITGYVPVLHNGQRSELLLTFDDANPYGYVAGIRAVYSEGETETIAKSGAALQEGDELLFLCDYYGKDGQYQDSYLLGDGLTVGEDGLTITDVPLEGTVRATYRFTDLYNQSYWTQPIPGAGT